MHHRPSAKPLGLLAQLVQKPLLISKNFEALVFFVYIFIKIRPQNFLNRFLDANDPLQVGSHYVVRSVIWMCRSDYQLKETVQDLVKECLSNFELQYPFQLRLDINRLSGHTKTMISLTTKGIREYGLVLAMMILFFMRLRDRPIAGLPEIID